MPCPHVDPGQGSQEPAPLRYEPALRAPANKLMLSTVAGTRAMAAAAASFTSVAILASCERRVDLAYTSSLSRAKPPALASGHLSMACARAREPTA